LFLLAAEGCKKARLKHPLEALNISRRWISGGGSNRLAALSELTHVEEAVSNELDRNFFVLISRERQKYINPLWLFGKDVESAFPSTQSSIKELSDCMAFDVSTGAVFHLMRIAEIGLRALAWDRRIKIPQKTPIDLATWEQVIIEL
jgi:hypothetical protein